MNKAGIGEVSCRVSAGVCSASQSRAIRALCLIAAFVAAGTAQYAEAPTGNNQYQIIRSIPRAQPYAEILVYKFQDGPNDCYVASKESHAATISCVRRDR